MVRGLIVSSLLLLLALAACARGPVYAEAELARDVAAEVNAVRRSQGLPPLKVNRRLTEAAFAHAADQAHGARMAHEGSNGSALPDRLLAAGYDFAQAKEAVAVGWNKPRNVTRGWWNSPSHRATLLYAPASDMGVGVVYGGDGKPYWTLIVAEPFG